MYHFFAPFIGMLCLEPSLNSHLLPWPAYNTAKQVYCMLDFPLVKLPVVVMSEENEVLGYRYSECNNSPAIQMKTFTIRLWPSTGNSQFDVICSLCN